MDKPMNAFQLACAIHAGFEIPVFPVRLLRTDSGKWNKQPLVKWSRISGNPHDVNWGGANSVGVPTGLRSGLFVIDLDDYKPGSEASSWVDARSLPATRTHKTASGGRHLIYRLPEGIDLGNRASIVTGLDTRGSGGFIVWGDIDGLYSVSDDRTPVELPREVCAELQTIRTSSGSAVLDASIPEYHYVLEQDLELKLDQLLSHPSGALGGLRKGQRPDIRGPALEGV